MGNAVHDHELKGCTLMIDCMFLYVNCERGQPFRVDEAYKPTSVGTRFRGHDGVVLRGSLGTDSEHLHGRVNR